MPVPLVDLGPQHAALLPELRRLFDDAVRSGQFILGPTVAGFEKHLAGYCGTKHAIGLSSGTDALLIALMALEIGPGDEVITSPFTFFATAGCVARVGAKPVFVDIDPVTFNLDPRWVGAAITSRTKAILPVHLYGQCAEMTPLLELAKRYGLKVIEDAAQAIGARDGDTPAGALGDIGCLSFYPTKNLAAVGDAGACTTQNDALDQRLRVLRVHGQEGEYLHSRVGGNFRLDALQAAVLNLKLARLHQWTEARRARARRYDPLLAGLPLTLPAEAPGKYHVFNQYTIRLRPQQRDGLKQHLAARGIGCRVYYPLPLHLQPCFEYLGGQPGQLPEAEMAAREVLSLPIFPELTDQQQDEVATAIREFFS